MKRAMIACARRTVLLADHTKVGNDYLARFGTIDDVDLFITDSGLDPEAAEQLERARTEAGPRVIVTLTLNPSLDRAVEVERAGARHGHPRNAGHPRPGRQGRERLAGAARRKRPLAGRPARRRPGRRSAGPPASRRGRRRRRGPDQGRHPVEHHPGRARRHRSPRSTNRVRPCRPPSSTRSPRRSLRPPAPPTGWPPAAACRPASPTTTTRAFAGGCVAAGTQVAVDTSGPALLAAVAAGPTVVKPNREELAEAVGAPLRVGRRCCRGRPGPARQGGPGRAGEPRLRRRAAGVGVRRRQRRRARRRAAQHGRRGRCPAGRIPGSRSGRPRGARRGSRLGGSRRRPSRQPNAGSGPDPSHRGAPARPARTCPDPSSRPADRPDRTTRPRTPEG